MYSVAQRDILAKLPSFLTLHVKNAGKDYDCRPAPERNSIKDLVSLEEDQASEETCQANTQTAAGRGPGQSTWPARAFILLPATLQHTAELSPVAGFIVTHHTAGES